MRYKQFVILLVVIFPVQLIHQESLFSQPMIATSDVQASKIGAEILHQGGNAIDAAVAVMFALPIIEPWASGLGGGGFMLIHLANGQESVIIDYRECAPIQAEPQLLYRDKESFRYYAYTCHRSICVPGMVAGARAALQKYGTMHFKDVIMPAIKLARNGFPVSYKFHQLISKYYDIVEPNRTSSAIFFPDYLPLAEGDSLRRPDLVQTYQIMAQNGVMEFYKGRIAQAIVEEIRLNNGLITIADLNSYFPIERKPVVGYYRGYDIVTIPPPGSGGVALIELLNILEGFDLKQYGYLSGDYIHIFVEALKYVLNDREHYAGDPDFQAINFEQFISKQHSAAIRAMIDTVQATSISVRNSSTKFESEAGSHVSIIDQHGNSVSLTQSINFYFGSGVTLPNYGILFNNGLFQFSQDSRNLNAVAPKKRSASSMAPTIVMKNGQPFLILGSTGAARTISTLAHIIVSVIDFQKSMKEAIDAPRFHFEDDAVQLEMRIESDAIEHLKKLGHRVSLKTDYNTYFGVAQGILVSAGSESTQGAHDPRAQGIVTAN